MAPMEYLGAWGTLIHEKNLKPKISCQTPFNPKRWAYFFREIVIETMGYMHRPGLDYLSQISWADKLKINRKFLRERKIRESFCWHTVLFSCTCSCILTLDVIVRK